MASYRVPAFRPGGQTVAGFVALRDLLSYLSFGGSVLWADGPASLGLGDEQERLHFPIGRHLPMALVGKPIAVRVAEFDPPSADSR